MAFVGLVRFIAFASLVAAAIVSSFYGGYRMGYRQAAYDRSPFYDPAQVNVLPFGLRWDDLYPESVTTQASEPFQDSL